MIDFSFRNDEARFVGDGEVAATGTAAAMALVDSVNFSDEDDDPLFWGSRFPQGEALFEVPDVRFNSHAKVPVQAVVSQPESLGRWEGVLTVGQTVTNLVVLSEDEFGHSGMSAAFDVRERSDTDDDRMPDDWEAANGLDPRNRNDAGGDLDGDGASNVREYLAGTDPRDAMSGLRLTTRREEDGTVALEFGTAVGRLYLIEATDDLVSARWEPLAGGEIYGNGRVFRRVLDGATLRSAGRFYRVRLVFPLLKN